MDASTGKDALVGESMRKSTSSEHKLRTSISQTSNYVTSRSNRAGSAIGHTPVALSGGTFQTRLKPITICDDVSFSA